MQLGYKIWLHIVAIWLQATNARPDVASLAWPDPIPRRGVIACSISAPLGKGSGTLHSVHSVFTLANLLI